MVLKDGEGRERGHAVVLAHVLREVFGGLGRPWRRMECTKHSVLYQVCCVEHTAHCSRCTMHSALFAVYCIQYTVHCALYTLHNTPCTVHSTQGTVHHTQRHCMQTVHCTSCTTHSALYTDLFGRDNVTLFVSRRMGTSVWTSGHMAAEAGLSALSAPPC